MVSEQSRMRFVYVTFFWQILMIVLYGLFTTYADRDHLADSGVGGLRDKYPFFQDVHVMIFVGFGFLMTFLKKYGYSSVAFNFLLSALTIQWAILCNGFWHNVHLGDWSHKIELDIVSLITGDFAAGAVMITFGALLGKVSPLQMFIVMVFEIFFYGLNEMTGALELHAVDMGGSMFVHTFGAYFGLAVSYVLTRPTEKKEVQDKNGPTKNSDMFAMIGTLFLWMFWPSFNGALATTEQQHRVVVNTVLALTASCVAAFFMDAFLDGGMIGKRHRKWDMVQIQNATLAGGVAVGSSSDLVIDPWGALLTGMVAGMISVVGYLYISPLLEQKFGLDDTCGVHNLHGIPGIIGALGGVISAASAGNDEYGESICHVFNARAPEASSYSETGSGGSSTLGDHSCSKANGGPGPGKGWSASEQAQTQLWALLITLGISIAGGVFTGLVVKYIGISLEEEAWYDDEEFWEVPEEEEDGKGYREPSGGAPVITSQ